MNIQLKQIIYGLFTVILATPLMITNSVADMDDMHGKMMHERGMQRGAGYNCDGMGMMGRGMGMMPMMGGGMMSMMGSGMGMMSMGGMSPMMAQMLDLDDKQRQKLRELMRAQRKTHLNMMNSMMDIHDELETAYDKDVVDAKAVGKIYNKMFENKRQMVEQMIETRNKFRAMLTDEQKKQFDKMRHGGVGMMPMMGRGMGMMPMME